MKKIILIILAIMIVFATITISTAELRSAVDGNDQYGYPFIFYTYFGGKCNPCPPEPSETHYGWLAVDILFVAIVTLVLIIGFNKLKGAYTRYRKE